MSLEKRKLGWALGGGVLLGAIAFATLALGAFDSDAAKEQDASAVTSEADGAGEGIKVHGDWVIEVRNADGSVAERQEFQNALTSGGSQFLDLTLARNASVGEWAVALIEIEGVSSPCESIACFITEVGGTHNWGTNPQATFPTLQLSTSDPGQANQFILQGNFVATNDRDINEVQAWGCFAVPPSLNPGVCNNAFAVTRKTLPSPVNVVAGQQVLVAVRISFS
jgi:hypothetical protein